MSKYKKPKERKKNKDIKYACDWCDIRLKT